MVVVCTKKEKKPHPAWVFLRKMPEKQSILFAWPNMKIRVWTVLWTIIRKARNHCQDVDKRGNEDHCQYHFGIDHCQTGNHCQDREHCQNGNEHSDR